MKRVLTYGTFDMLHYGHIELLRRAKEYGDYLVVGISTDEFNKKKGKESHFNYEVRKEMLSAIKYVDEIIPENDWQQKSQDVQKYDIDVFVMGDDWHGKFDELEKYCQVVYLGRTPVISSTALKQLHKTSEVLAVEDK